MKKVIQITLILILILFIYFFYKQYFNKEEVIIEKDINLIKEYSSNNNFIKNLTYKINIDENQSYNLQSKISEVTYEDSFELVKMQEVRGVFTTKNFENIVITSNQATYNNKNYNTKFEEKVQLKYLNNTIEADILILDFENQSIIISGNVVYNGLYGSLVSDNIELDLITKKINIFMNELKNKVFVNVK